MSRPDTASSTTRGQILPAFRENAIPVVFSTDDNYAPLLSVAIQSLLENASSSNNYDIIILERDLHATHKEKLASLARASNISIRFHSVNEFFQHRDMSLFFTEKHFTVAVYYRFFIPEIFRAYDKVIYLDSDIVVLEDIAYLYGIDMGDSVVAAARNVYTVYAFLQGKVMDNRDMTFERYISDVVGMKSVLNYIQSGIMLFHVRRAAAFDLTGRCLRRLKEIQTPRYVDQDVLASVCQDDLHILPLQWNHVWYMQDYAFLKGMVPASLFQEYDASRKKPSIIHYAGSIRPWTHPEKLLAHHFWQYARQSPYYELLLIGLARVKGLALPDEPSGRKNSPFALNWLRQVGKWLACKKGGRDSRKGYRIP